VRIHAVVDYRTAPSLGDIAHAMTASIAGATGASSSSATQSTSSTQQDPNALALALQASIGGQLLYFAVE